jgi:hypothetical protein
VCLTPVYYLDALSGLLKTMAEIDRELENRDSGCKHTIPSITLPTTKDGRRKFHIIQIQAIKSRAVNWLLSNRSLNWL